MILNDGFESSGETIYLVFGLSNPHDMQGSHVGGAFRTYQEAYYWCIKNRGTFPDFAIRDAAIMCVTEAEKDRMDKYSSEEFHERLLLRQSAG